MHHEYEEVYVVALRKEEFVPPEGTAGG